MGHLIDEMVRGYGSKFPGIAEMFLLEPLPQDFERMRSPVASLGRYYKSVRFLEQVTSGRSVGLKRFEVIIDYFLALNELLSGYTGKHRRVVHGLTSGEIEVIRTIGTTEKEIFQAEFLEKFSEHDTAAAGDYVKFKIACLLPHLEKHVEGVHFGITSEDVMGNVFGMIGNELVYDHFIPRLMNFCLRCIDFVVEHEKDAPLLLPALTHKQPAEPNTLCKKYAVRLKAIEEYVSSLISQDDFYPFSGILSGAVGNLSCHYAAYPDIDWQQFANLFVIDRGLQYQKLTDQCVSYAVESRIFSTIANMLNEVVKFAEDFVEMASCPAQLFIKVKKPGTKGSSIMPNKSNAWMIEGAIAMLLKGINNLRFLAERLPRYPLEGNMERSFPMRDIGNDFMPIFIGLDRIEEEMFKYTHNPVKIKAFFDEYPGMAGSVLQTLLKREGIVGDAYRLIETISINRDGTYADADQFKSGLEWALNEFGWDANSEFHLELLDAIKPENIVREAQKMANEELGELACSFNGFKEWLREFRSGHRNGEAGKIFNAA